MWNLDRESFAKLNKKLFLFLVCCKVIAWLGEIKLTMNLTQRQTKPRGPTEFWFLTDLQFAKFCLLHTHQMPASLLHV